MFVTLTCERCNKSFQATSRAGTGAVPCPWCQSAISVPGGEPAPLSLDAAVQLPPVSPAVPTPTLPPVRSRSLIWLALVCVAVGLTAFAVSRYGSGNVPESAWQKYQPADASFEVLLPGEPSEEPRTEPARSPSMRDGGQVIVRRRFEGVNAWVTWVDLIPDRVKSARPEDLIASERERRVAELPGKPIAVGGLKFGPWTGEEVRYETANGPAVERVIAVTTGSYPRVYCIGVSGPNVPPDGAVARRVLNSFHISGGN